MKKIVKSVILISSLLLGLNSCKEKVTSENLVPNNEIEEILIPNTAKITDFKNLRIDGVNDNNDAEEFAKLLAVTLKDKDFRKFLKDEANKKFDGDFDILLTNVLEANVGSSKFKEKMKANSSKGEEIFTNILKNKLYNISIPVFNDKWNVSKEIPIVAVSTEVAEGKTKQIKGFDKNGSTYLIDAEIAPNLPVILIGFNERVKYDQNGDLKVNNFLPINENLNSKQGTKNSKLLGTNTFNDNAYVYLTGMTISNLSHYEYWTKGAPEICLRAYCPSTATIGFPTGLVRELLEMEPSSRNAIISPNWYNPNSSVIIWNSSLYSKSILVHFYESDGGVEIEVPISAKFKILGVETSLGVTLKKKSNDDEIGKMIITQDVAPPFDNYYDIASDFYARFSN